MILIPEVCGTCGGSNKAINLVYEVYKNELTKNKPKKIYIYKEILHNSEVIQELDNLEIKTIDDLSLVTKNDIVIIRAHGEGLDTYRYLEKNHIEYYDATCPNVLKIHQQVKEKYNNGYEIIIVGKESHPEVLGINGWCNHKGIIINTKDDLNKLGSNHNKFVICQTTFNQDKFKDIVNELNNKYSNYNIEVFDSHCNAVERIIESSVKIAKKSDFMFAIGGLNSSNTEELYKEVNKYTKAYKVSNIKDFYNIIKNNNFDNKIIGITGGASTPQKEIGNYKSLLEFFLYYKKKLKELKISQNIINNKLLYKDDNRYVKDLIKEFIDLNQDGKYIRATLISLGYYLAKKEDSIYYRNLAYAYEMFQTSILVHDDIIDKSKIRRGKDTIHERIWKKYYNNNDLDYQNDLTNLSNSLAMCIGDLGFYEVNKLIINSYKNNNNLIRLLDYFNNAVIKTCKGEIIDVYLPFLGKYQSYNCKEKDILDIYHLKTSWYTIIGPFNLGFILGGKNPSKKIDEVLDLIGLAFQLKDDIIGIFNDDKTLGKPNVSDIEEFKQTILYSHIINTKYKNEFLNIYGNKNIDIKELEKIRKLLIKSGSYDYANKMLDDLKNKAIKGIDELKINKNIKDILKGLLIYICIREK